jgi:hypothetical protein
MARAKRSLISAEGIPNSPKFKYCNLILSSPNIYLMWSFFIDAPLTIDSSTFQFCLSLAWFTVQRVTTLIGHLCSFGMWLCRCYVLGGFNTDRDSQLCSSRLHIVGERFKSRTFTSCLLLCSRELLEIAVDRHFTSLVSEGNRIACLEDTFSSKMCQPGQRVAPLRL